MKELVNQESITALKKSRKNILIVIAISVVVFAAIVVPLFFLVNRSTKSIFNIVLAVVATAEASFILYMLVVCLVPLNSYLKICSLSLDGNKFSTLGRVKEVANKITHYRGVAVRAITVLDVEENKEYTFYVEQTSKEDFTVDRVYKFITYQSVIIGYEDL